MLVPTDLGRRSFVYRALVASGARFVALDGAAVAEDFGADPAAETAAARGLGLADLSPLPRTGFKGPGALAWLAARGPGGIAADNRAYRQPDGSLVARLAPTEVVVLSDLGARASLAAKLDAAWSIEAAPGCY